jgi:hypothetical protein
MDAELIATARLPGSSATHDGPDVATWSRRRLVVVREDAAIIAYDVGSLFAGDPAPAVAFRRHGRGESAASTRSTPA